MIVSETICDQCGERKGKTNHWFSLYIEKAEGGTENDLMGIHDGFHFYKDSDKHDKRNKDICSMQCATHALQEFMSPNNLPKLGAEQ